MLKSAPAASHLPLLLSATFESRRSMGGSFEPTKTGYHLPDTCAGFLMELILLS